MALTESVARFTIVFGLFCHVFFLGPFFGGAGNTFGRSAPLGYGVLLEMFFTGKPELMCGPSLAVFWHASALSVRQL